MSTAEETSTEEAPTTRQTAIDIHVICPNGASVVVAQANPVDPVSFVRQTLLELQETAPYTCYHFEIDGAHISEFSEIAVYAPVEGDSMTLTMVPDLYDVKKARAQIKRVREMVLFPPISKGSASGHSTDEKEKAADDSSSGESEEKKPETKPFDGKLPSVEELLSSPGFETFYEEALLRTGKPEPQLPPTVSKAPSDSMKSVAISGWNPPAPARRTQGDLLYIEAVTADDGIFHITATPNGFFVNKSTRYVFDPSPAQNAHFSHELLYTLIGASAGLRTSWASLCAASDSTASKTSFGPLDGIASYFNQGRGDQVTQRPQWNLPPLGLFTGDKGHTFDLSRAQEDLSDNFGVDEHGAPREWNEEVQSIRSLTSTVIGEKVTRARFSQKTIQEFTEAAKQATLAINDGHIVPMNPTEPQESHLYMYNNIFISRVMDTKDNFKLYTGDEANRKGTAQDMRNQRFVQAMGIPGLFTGLMTIVDFKGERYLAQTVVPGVLSGGIHAARLMYGTLEPGKRVSVKAEALEIMKEVGKKIFMPQRNIAAVPVLKTEETKVQPHDPIIAGGISSLLANDIPENEQLGVKTDEEDEVVPLDSTSVPHYGPVEGKILMGTDGRLYALELMRLTPRDANFVKGSKGTGLISEEALKAVDDEVAKTYVLRQELITQYVLGKIGEKRQQVILEVAAAKREKDAAKKAAKDATAAGEDKDKKEKDGKGTDSNKEEEENEEDDEETALLTKEVTDKIQAITPESLGLEINPNVFFDGVVSDVDPAIAAKDEATARELATFLMKETLPMITNQVRINEVVPMDNEALVGLLHTAGVNMRYLGELARLAYEEEMEDDNLRKQQKQRIQSFPQYWLEMLECEILARCVKHHFAALFRAHPEIRSYPAQTIASLFNYIFGSNEKPEESPEAIAAELVADSGAKGGSKKKKGKSHKTVPGASEESTVPSLPDVTASREETLAAIKKEAAARFCYSTFHTVNFKTVQQIEDDLAATLATLNFDTPDSPKDSGNDKKKDKKKNKKEDEDDPKARTIAAISKVFRDSAKKVLSGRLSAIPLLRRVCLVTGVRVATRRYDFSSATPFTAGDIIAVNPLVKSCEPLVPLPEARELLNGARSQLSEGNFPASFELLQEATNWIGQITGPLHKEALATTDMFTSLFAEVGDVDRATSTSTKALAVAVQLMGLDSQDAIMRHMQLAAFQVEQNNFSRAIDHLFTAKYLVGHLGGPRHIQQVDIFLRLGNVFLLAGNDELAVNCYSEARKRTNDISKHAFISQTIAEIIGKMGDYEFALNEQRNAHRVIEQLCGAQDDRAVEAKARVEVYRRKVTEHRVEAYKQQRELAALKALEEAQPKTNFEIVGDMKDSGKGKGGSKKKGSVKKGSRK